MKFTNRIAPLLIFCTAFSMHLKGEWYFSSHEIDVAEKNLLQLVEKGYCYNCDFRCISQKRFRKFIKIAIDNKNNGKFKNICLINCNLRDQNLSGLDLDGIILRGSKLTGVNLSNSSLRGADLSETLSDEVDAYGACMDNVFAWKSDWGGSRLSRASCKNAFFRNADLSYCKIIGTNFEGADLGDADMDPIRDYYFPGEYGYDRANFKNIKGIPKAGRILRDDINSQNSLFYAFVKKIKKL